MKQLYKGQKIAIHVLDEHILPLMPLPIPLGGRIDDWEAYWIRCSEILGLEYDQAAVIAAGYFITRVEDLVGDQILFRDTNDELRLVPADQVITQEEAPKAFEIWLRLQ